MLNFGSYAELSRLLSPKTLELLEAVSEHEPESIREAAELVDQDHKQVHRNFSELEGIGVIEFEGGGSGQAKNPKLAYDGLEIDISFAPSTGVGDGSTPPVPPLSRLGRLIDADQAVGRSGPDDVSARKPLGATTVPGVCRPRLVRRVIEHA